MKLGVESCRAERAENRVVRFCLLSERTISSGLFPLKKLSFAKSGIVLIQMIRNYFLRRWSDVLEKRHQEDGYKKFICHCSNPLPIDFFA